MSGSEILDVLGRGELSVWSDGWSSGEERKGEEEVGDREGEEARGEDEVDGEWDEVVSGIGEVGLEWLGHK